MAGFHLDENVSATLALALQHARHDVLTANAAGLAVVG